MFRPKSARRFLTYLMCLFMLATMASCSVTDKQAVKSVDDYLRKVGARDVKPGIFVTRQDFPDRAYLGVVATWNFTDPKGEPQKESLGYILKKDGETWRIEKNVQFTDDKARARELIEGRK